MTDQVNEYQVRGKTIRIDNYTTSLSHQQIPKIAPPPYQGWGELLTFLQKENLPGSYPYTGGVYPYRRTGEDPIRMFAGEGTPERTNRRFHYLSVGQPAARLSTAFDSVTLYGEDPAVRPDIFGKIGNEAGNDPLALAAVLRRPRQEPFTAAQLAQISNPVVVAIGDKDFSHPADALAAAFAQGRLVELPGIDHFRTPESFNFIDLVMSLFA